MEWTDMIVLYGSAIAAYLDGLTKTDLMILLGTLLLGNYFGSKKDERAKKSGV